MAVAAFAMRPDLPERIFGPAELGRLTSVVEIDTHSTITDFARADPGLLANIEILITGWGSPAIGPAELTAMPRLRAIIHAAGTVKGHIAPDAWDSGILVTTAAAANAYPVAEYTLAMILLAGKNVPQLSRDYASTGTIDLVADYPGIGNYRRTVGVIGASRIGRRVIDLLRPFDFDVLLYDPHLAPADPVLSHATAVGLDDLFARASIVSIHAPLLAETRNMIGARQLGLLAPNSTIINTARAAIIDQDALVAAMRERPLSAVLDVTDPEPLPADHPLRSMPRALLTPHAAGAGGNELRRLGESATRDVELVVAGLPPEHPVTKDALAGMA